MIRLVLQICMVSGCAQNTLLPLLQVMSAAAHTEHIFKNVSMLTFTTQCTPNYHKQFEKVHMHLQLLPPRVTLQSLVI